MMKKIGFIDYFIDEWHANNYPKMIRESSLKDKFDVSLAWEEITPEGKKNLDQWCQEQQVGKAASIKQVVEECDCIIVLSPDNAERHEDLADLPLRSGKPVYIDKPIAPSLAAASRLFDKAQRYGTPMMSSSALRFGSALQKALDEDLKEQRVNFVSVRGGGVFHIYAIHQLEMLVMVMGTGARRVMQCGTTKVPLMIVDYEDGRRGSINLLPGYAFQLSAQYGENKSLAIDTMDDFFPLFIEAMLAFFDSGKSVIPQEQTLEIAALIEAGNAALLRPDTWVDVPGAM
ncbi:MAG: Gfo/Idh/MocA family oxidoreductase [bacterium]|nr:Gfo/Idh/MocA family oxidoreductase [bacterium]MDD4558127.1 Gfo/Idh/MocA family oxidoreductase [bacterium]